MASTNENEIALMVMDIVTVRLDVKDETLTRSTRLVEDLNADSLGVMELALALEEAFDVDVANEQVPKLRTVQDVIELIEKTLPFQPGQRSDVRPGRDRAEA